MQLYYKGQDADEVLGTEPFLSDSHLIDVIEISSPFTLQQPQDSNH